MSSNQELLDAGNVGVSDRGTSRFHPAISLVALVTVLLIYIALRLRHLGTYSLWCDEAFSVFVAKSSWHDFFRQLLIDRVHPPLYYLLLKLWISVLGASVAGLRLFSVLFSALTLLPLWSCMKEVRLSPGLKLALLFAIACNPFLILYSQEVRMYSLLCLLSVWSFDLYLKQSSERPWLRILWSLVNVALVMVHVAGLAVVGCELAHAALARTAFWHRLVTCLPALFALLSWIIAVKVFAPDPGRVLHNIAWISRLTPALEWKTLTHLLGSTLGAIVLNVPVAIAIWTRRNVERRFASLFLLLSIATMAFVFGFSMLVKPVWQERYLIITVIPYYLLAGDSIRQISPKWALRCTVAIAVVGLLSLEHNLTHRPDRPIFTSFVSSSGEPIFASDDLAGAPLAIRQSSQEIPIRIIKASSLSNSGGLTLTVREVSYSIGEREGLIENAHYIHEKEFLYAFDTTADPMSPPGLLPSDLSSYGCAAEELAETRGQGRKFVFYKVSCT
jgi:hypothetical protein